MGIRGEQKIWRDDKGCNWILNGIKNFNSFPLVPYSKWQKMHLVSLLQQMLHLGQFGFAHGQRDCLSWYYSGETGILFGEEIEKFSKREEKLEEQFVVKNTIIYFFPLAIPTLHYWLSIRQFCMICGPIVPRVKTVDYTGCSH